MLCLIFSDGICTQFITPVQTEAYAKHGDKVKLSCVYSSVFSIHWYRQYPASTPQFLFFSLQNNGKPENIRLEMSMELNEENHSTDLEIFSVNVSDEAIYYCALKPTVRENTSALYKNLILTPQHIWILKYYSHTHVNKST